MYALSTDKMSESEKMRLKLEGEIAKYKDRIRKLEENLEKAKKKAQDEIEKERSDREKVGHTCTPGKQFK